MHRRHFRFDLLYLLTVAWAAIALGMMGGAVVYGCAARWETTEDARQLAVPGQAALPGNNWLPVLQFDIDVGTEPARFELNGLGLTWRQIYLRMLQDAQPFTFVELPGGGYAVDVNTPPDILFNAEPQGDMPTILTTVKGMVRPTGANRFITKYVTSVALAVDGSLGFFPDPVCDPDRIAVIGEQNVAQINASALARRYTEGLIVTGPEPGSGPSNGYYDPGDPIISVFQVEPSDTENIVEFEFEPYQEFVTIDEPVPEGAIEETTGAIAFDPIYQDPEDPEDLTPEMKAGIIDNSTLAAAYYNLFPNLVFVPGLDIITGDVESQNQASRRRYFLLVKLSAAAPHGAQFAAGLTSVMVYQGHAIQPGADIPGFCFGEVDLLATANPGPRVISFSADPNMADYPITVVENANDITPRGTGAGYSPIEDPYYPPQWPRGVWLPINRGYNLRPGDTWDQGISFLRTHPDPLDTDGETRTNRHITGQRTPKVWAPEENRRQVIGIELGGGQINNRVRTLPNWNDPPEDQRIKGSRTRLDGLLVEFVSCGAIREIPADGIDNNKNAFWVQRNGIDDDLDSDDDDDNNPYTPAVADGIDNDGDSYIDENIDEIDEGIDEFFVSPDMLEDNDNNPNTPPVRDGIDNDGDDLIDEVNHIRGVDNTVPRPLIAVPEVGPGRNDDGDSYVEFHMGVPYSQVAGGLPTGNRSLRYRNPYQSPLFPERYSYSGPTGSVSVDLGTLGLFDAGIDLPIVDTVRDLDAVMWTGEWPVMGQLDGTDRINVGGLLGPDMYQMYMAHFMNQVQGRPVPDGVGAESPMGRILTAMDDDGDGFIDEETLDNFDNDGDGFIDEDVYNWQLVKFDDDKDGLFDEDGEDGLDNDGDGFIDEDITFSDLVTLTEEEIPNYFVDVPERFIGGRRVTGTDLVFDPGIDQYYIDFNGNGVYDRAFGSGDPLDRDEFVSPGWVNDELGPLLAPGQAYVQMVDDDGDAESLFPDRIDNDGDAMDSDEDGYVDGQELAQGFDPFAASDSPADVGGEPEPPWLYIDEGFNEDISNADFDPDDINEDFGGASELDGLQLYVDSDQGGDNRETVDGGDGEWDFNVDDPERDEDNDWDNISAGEAGENNPEDYRISLSFTFVPRFGAYDELTATPQLAGRFGAYIQADPRVGAIGTDANEAPWTAIPHTNDGNYDYYIVMRTDSDDTGGAAWRRTTGIDYGDDWQMQMARGGIRLLDYGAPATARKVQNLQGCVPNEGDPLDPMTILGPNPALVAEDGRPFAAVTTKRQIAGLYSIDVQSTPPSTVYWFPAEMLLDELLFRDGQRGNLASRITMVLGDGSGAASYGSSFYSGSGVPYPYLTPLQTHVPVLGLNIAAYAPGGGGSFNTETINKIRLNFISVDTEGNGTFEPSDLMALDPDPVLSGIALVMDSAAGIGSIGELQWADYAAGGIRLNADSTAWSDPVRDSNDPVVRNGGYFVVLTPQEPIRLPTDDFQFNASADLFVVLRASRTADYHDAFQVFIRPGDIDFRNKRNGVRSLVITAPYAIDLPIEYTDFLPGGKTVGRNSESFAAVGLDLVDANATFRGETSRLQALRLSIFDGGGAVQFNPESDLAPLTADIRPVSQLLPERFPPETTDNLRRATLSGVALYRDMPGSDRPGVFDDPLDPNVIVPDTPLQLSGDEDLTFTAAGATSTVTLLLDPPSPNYDPDEDGIFSGDLAVALRGIPGGESNPSDGIDRSEMVDPYDTAPFELVPPRRDGQYTGPDLFLVLRTSDSFAGNKRFRVGILPYEPYFEFGNVQYPTFLAYPRLINAERRPFPLSPPKSDTVGYSGLVTNLVTARDPFNARPTFRFINPPQFDTAKPNLVYQPPRDVPEPMPPLPVIWEDADPDNNASITIRQVSLPTGEEVVLISGIAEDNDADDSFDWDLSMLTPGLYRLKAAITDNVNPTVVSESRNVEVRNDPPAIQIIQPAAAPRPVPSGSVYVTTWNDFDYENNADIILWLDPSAQRPLSGPSIDAVTIAVGIEEDSPDDFYEIPFADLVNQGVLPPADPSYAVWVGASIDDLVVRGTDPDTGRPITGLRHAVSAGQVLVQATVFPTLTPTIGPGTPSPTPVYRADIDIPTSETERESVYRRQQIDIVWRDGRPRPGATRTLYWMNVVEPPPMNPSTQPVPPADRILRAFDNSLACCLPDETLGQGSFRWDFGDVPPGTYYIFMQITDPFGFEQRVATSNTFTIPRLRWPLYYPGRTFETAPLVTEIVVEGRVVPIVVAVSTDGLLQAFDADGMRLGRSFLDVQDVFSSPVMLDGNSAGRPLFAVGARDERLLVSDLMRHVGSTRMPTGERVVTSNPFRHLPPSVLAREVRCTATAKPNTMTCDEVAGFIRDVTWAVDLLTDVTGALAALPDEKRDLVETTAAATDWDDDGLTDLVIGSRSGRAYLLTGQPLDIANVPESGKPLLVAARQNLGQPIEASPVLGNLIGEPTPEIVLTNVRGDVFVIEPHAAIAEQAPVPKPIRTFGSRIRSAPAVFDLDGDGLDEIVVALATISSPTRGRVYAMDATGALLTRDGKALSDMASPLSNQPVVASLAVGHVDGDGLPDIIAANSEQIFVYSLAIDEHGIVESVTARTWRGEFSLSAPVVGEFIAADPNAQEIVVGGRNLQPTPTVRAGTPTPTPFYSEELVWLRFDRAAGRLAPSRLLTGAEPALRRVLVPREIQGLQPLIGAPALADLDGDRTTDLVLATRDGRNGWLAVVKVTPTPVASPSTGAPKLDWPQLKRDARRTGRFGPPLVLNPTLLAMDLNADGLLNYVDLFLLAERWAPQGGGSGLTGEGGLREGGSQTLLNLIENWHDR